MNGKRTKRTPKKAVTRLGRWDEPFLLSLAASGNVTVACSEAAIGRTIAYERREKDSEFARRWALALEDAADLLEAEARRRAAEGVNEPVIYQGQMSGDWINSDGQRCKVDEPGATFIPLTIKKYSDTLLIFLLKGARPEKYRDNAAVDVTSGGKSLAMVKVLRGVSMDDL